MMELRDYQHRMLDGARDYLRRGIRRIVLHAPTGAGKTVLSAAMLGNAAKRGLSSVFAVHRREILRQSSDTFRAVNITHGVIAPGFMYTPQRVQIASIATLARRIDKLPVPDLIVVDECHHAPSKSWSAILHRWSSAAVCGLSATPSRLDGRGLSELFDVIVSGPSTADLIRDGWLCPYRVFAPPGISVEGVHTRMGDYANDELEKASDKPTITGDAVAHYLRLCRGKRAIVFCVSVQHSMHVAEAFNAAGVIARHVDGDTPDAERDATMDAFARGDVKVVTNCALFSEGLDIVGIEAVILLRPTQSLALHLQQVGRALRPAPGKREALILDHAGNSMRLGLPDDEREWTLEGRERGRRTQNEVPVPIKTCPKCYAVCRAQVLACECGHRFIAEGRAVQVVDGELTEVNVELLRAQQQRQARREQGSADSIDKLIALGRARGYKNPGAWARFVLRAREQKRRRSA